MRKPLELSAELVAKVHRDIPFPGPDPERVAMSDADYEAATGEVLAELGDKPLLVFGYGSLLWKPGFDYSTRWPAMSFGWHRRFCMKLSRWRGSDEQPGLMMALEPGGMCRGELFGVAPGSEREQVEKLLRREIPFRRLRPAFRWITARDHEGCKRALTFYAGMRGEDNYVRLSIQEQAHMLARAAGHGGSGAGYLQQTIARLEEVGLHDEYLWRLQKLVAAEIRGFD